MAFTLKLPANMANRLEELAHQRGISAGDCAVALLEEAMDQGGEPVDGMFRDGAEAVAYWKRHGVGETWSRRDDLEAVFGSLEPSDDPSMAALSK